MNIRTGVRKINGWNDRRRSQAGSSASIRSDQRYFRILLTATSAAAAKVVSVVVQLAMVPLMLSVLGDYSYGIWLTLQSLIGFSAFADLGIGNGAMNAISAAQSRGDHDRINRIITSAVLMLTALAIVALFAIPIAYAWVSQLQLGGDHATDIASGVAIFTAYFALAMPLGFVDRVNAAFQEGAVTNIGRSVVAIMTLAATWLAVWMGGAFSTICIATLAPQLVGWLVIWGVEYRRRKWLSIGWRLFERGLARDLLGVGVLFLGVQVLSALNWSMDNLLISALLGPEQVTRYGIQVRVFGLVGTIASMLLTPLWPAYADAVAHGDQAWIKDTLRRSLIGAVIISVPLAFGVAAALPYILHTWTDDAVRTTPALAFGLASFTVCQTICAALAMFWNGTSAIRLQFFIGLALLLVSFPLKILVLRSPGIDWLGFVSAGLTVGIVLVPAFFLVKAKFVSF